MKKGPQRFDLPIYHLPKKDGRYIPTISRDVDETTRRRSLPSGVLLLEQQRSGTEIITHSLQQLEHDEEQYAWLAQKLAGACLNSSWYSFADLIEGDTPAAQPISVTRRNLALPIHAKVENDTATYKTRHDSVNDINKKLSKAERLSGQIVLARIELNEDKISRRSREYGRLIGGVGLELAAVSLARTNGEPEKVQMNVRDRGVKALSAAKLTRSSTNGYSVHDSLAQLPDEFSPLSVSFHDKSTPKDVLRAITFAREYNQSGKEQQRAS